ncbi:hypothetical protein NDU88_006208 [Pleurodeles waltl]|uniref:Uncharacterized protein n=1 Tax=Pleurodeles waltl TaxID=8319 RepID=A0AAV7L6A7_PLEWA|nr:hypothetical protein NDU88_006208 [Pleurodeles waltl]
MPPRPEANALQGSAPPSRGAPAHPAASARCAPPAPAPPRRNEESAHRPPLLDDHSPPQQRAAARPLLLLAGHAAGGAGVMLARGAVSRWPGGGHAGPGGVSASNTEFTRCSRDGSPLPTRGAPPTRAVPLARKPLTHSPFVSFTITQTRPRPAIGSGPGRFRGPPLRHLGGGSDRHLCEGSVETDPSATSLPPPVRV